MHKTINITSTDKRLFRGYTLKEQLKLALKIKLKLKKSFSDSLVRSTQPKFQFLRSLHIKLSGMRGISSIPLRLSLAMQELSQNRKIKLFIRKAHGFRNIQNMIDMIMLGCSKIFIPLPNRGENVLKAA